MKILLVHNLYRELGGEDEVVKTEIKLLRDFGHTVIPYFRSNAEFERFTFIQKVRFLFSEMIWSKKSFEDITALIDREKPDLAHVHNIFYLISPSVYSALRKNASPLSRPCITTGIFVPRGFFTAGEISVRNAWKAVLPRRSSIGAGGDLSCSPG